MDSDSVVKCAVVALCYLDDNLPMLLKLAVNGVDGNLLAHPQRNFSFSLGAKKFHIVEVLVVDGIIKVLQKSFSTFSQILYRF